MKSSRTLRQHLMAGACGLAVIASSGVIAGCTGSDDSSAGDASVEARIERERDEAAAAARQEEQVRELRKELRELKQGQEPKPPSNGGRSSSGGGTAASGDSAPVGASRGEQRTFHAGAGNVSCAISADAAACSVASLGATFVVRRGGGSATREPGLTLSRGAGERLGYGTSVSVGTFVCSIPPESAPRGLTCEETSAGHGFEASRVAARQRVW